ncbi:MAG: hypothetical protein QM773_03200 [Hyphomonadaceae bacterium]
MLRRFHHLAAIAVVAVLGAAPAHATDFLKAIEDVPVFPGLAEAAEPVVFESDQGRVVRTNTDGRADYGAVRDFYLASLPSLGWKREGAGEHGPFVFTREHERLTLSIEPAAGTGSPINVIFELVAKLASTRLPE